jgi:hypothetical protein
VLKEKGIQMKSITEGHGKTKTEVELLKSRNKEVEGMVLMGRGDKHGKVELEKGKLDGKRIEEKLAMVRKTMGELETALMGIGNSLGCKYCLEPVR